MGPIPAEPPLAGPLWTLIVPALLFVIALLATIGLYRRFSGSDARSHRRDDRDR